MAATPSTIARKPQNRRGRLSTLKTAECQGKSKFFLEHQAMREEENKVYDPSAHSWRFTEPAPLPTGKWKWKFPKPVLDEKAREEKARLSREEKQLLHEKLQRRQRVEAEFQRRKKQFPPGKAPSDKQLRKEVIREDRLAMAEERHVKNVQMALRVMNKRYTDRKYELGEITEKCTIFEYGSAYCHYNFIAYCPANDDLFCFAEVDANLENENDVYQCCTIGSGPDGYCMGCQNQRVAVIHPRRDMFIGGQESFGGFETDSESDVDY